MITQDRLKDLVHYEPDTGVFTCRATGRRLGRIGRKGYRRILLDGRRYLAGRLAWFYIHGVWPEPTVDHDNRVRSDDRLENLREASWFVQAANRGMFRNNQVGVLGVYPDGEVFRVQRTVHGQKLRFGRYASLERAKEVSIYVYSLDGKEAVAYWESGAWKQ